MNHLSVQRHYEAYPYPDYPIYAFGRWKDLESVDLSTWSIEGSIKRLWIAGCGTIAPLMFARRNPMVSIVASDLSKSSIRRAKWRSLIWGYPNIEYRCEDLLAHESSDDLYDAIDCYGVIHHTVNPRQTYELLLQKLRPGGVLRLMVYSEKNRSEIENLRSEIKSSGITSLKEISKLLKARNINIRGDLSNRSGIADALMHPLVHVYTKEGFSELITHSSVDVISLSETHNFIAKVRKKII